MLDGFHYARLRQAVRTGRVSSDEVGHRAALPRMPRTRAKAHEHAHDLVDVRAISRDKANDGTHRLLLEIDYLAGVRAHGPDHRIDRETLTGGQARGEAKGCLCRIDPAELKVARDRDSRSLPVVEDSVDD